MPGEAYHALSALVANDELGRRTSSPLYLRLDDGTVIFGPRRPAHRNRRHYAFLYGRPNPEQPRVSKKE